MNYRWTVEYGVWTRTNSFNKGESWEGWRWVLAAKGEFCGGPVRKDWTQFAEGFARSWRAAQRGAKARMRKDQMRRHFCREW